MKELVLTRNYFWEMLNFKSDMARNLFIWMCRHVEYNTGYVDLSTDIRNKIAEELQIEKKSITGALSILKKSGIIAGEKNKFQINPELFWKGDHKLREELLKDNLIKRKFNLYERGSYTI